ncbi:MAG: YfiT family bacillithiol transferase [Flavobacteriales bacterium]
MFNIEKLKYPIGNYKKPKQINKQDINTYIETISNFPNWVIGEVKNLNPKQLNYKYRPKGWTIQQIVLHCIDSHTNSIMRFKLALTEDNPTIKPYHEALWAKLADSINYHTTEALQLLKLTHNRWVFLLKNMTEEDFNKTFFHPENNQTVSLKENLSIYHWHCKHHLQHIKNAKKYQY